MGLTAIEKVRNLRQRVRCEKLETVQFLQAVDEISRALLDSDFLESPVVLKPNIFLPGHKRPKRLCVNVGGVMVGGDHDIIVQSMAINSLRNFDQLTQEFKDLVDAGSQIVRIAVTGQEDARHMRLLKENLAGTRYANVPVVMCGQYNVSPIIRETDILDHIAKLRINPGNISLNAQSDDNFVGTIKYLVEYNSKLTSRPKIAVRVGVNWGSIDEKLKVRAMDINATLPKPRDSKDVERIVLAVSTISSALYAELLGLEHNLIIVSAKTSTVADSFIVSQLLHQMSDYPIHLGITEAGSGVDGVILTASGLSPILLSGIGDTIRCSITPRMDESRTKEVEICKQVLQATGLRIFKPRVNSCPGCGRTDSSYFRVLTERVGEFVDSNLSSWCKKHGTDDVRKLNIAVMGCLVNGPGESKHADIGISLPGYRESHSALVYVDGKKFSVLRATEGEIEQQFFAIIEDYIEKRFSAKPQILESQGLSI